jgi:hypothetical protein
MDGSASNPTARPRFLWAAIIAAALLVPGLMLADRLAAAGGDGLQGFWPGVLVLAGSALTSMICTVIGLVRGERPRWLALIALALWCLPVLWLAF